MKSKIISFVQTNAIARWTFSVVASLIITFALVAVYATFIWPLIQKISVAIAG